MNVMLIASITYFLSQGGINWKWNYEGNRIVNATLEEIVNGEKLL